MAKLSVDLDLVGALADLMDDKGLTEVEYSQGEQTLRLARGGAVAAGAVYAAAPAPMGAPAPAVAESPSAEPAAHPGAVPSPMVGTAYLSAQPGAPTFVSVGDTVAEDQTLLIVEAMKVMNPITAPKAGKIVAVYVADGEPVEFGQPLVAIE
ncbi:MAG: acetyl-CoA carboxylase biotin carboxyl carrier protein [Alphaproteobacteria bacterium]|nr:acetyl-CoA carboxylase biotin carboxyl carrier protein [Alphaproteobacteria bacterium]